MARSPGHDDSELACSPTSSPHPLPYSLVASHLDMTYNSSSSCVYNVPMALEPTLSRTHGLDPSFARSRCKANVADSMDYILGPMPPAEFLDYFFPLQPRDKSGLLSSYNAFRSLPSRAETAAEVYEPLVSGSLCERRKARLRAN